jgi:carbonic anhydrase
MSVVSSSALIRQSLGVSRSRAARIRLRPFWDVQTRGSPQLIFDQGIGDLFVNRIAGHLVDEAMVASIAYSVNTLEVPLVVVLGHSSCGAVAATVARYTEGTTCDDPLSRFILPAVQRAATLPGNLLDNAVRQNITLTVAQLRTDPLLRHKVASGELLIIGALYELASGLVTFFEEDSPDTIENITEL